MSVSCRIAAALNRAAFGLADTVHERRLSILLFHRVRAQPDALFPNEIDARRFDRLMALVARSFNVVTLSRAIVLMRTDSLPRRSLVITFDDGYADNEEIALPILRKHNLVASFFVATGFLDGGCMWNDSVIESVRACGHDAIDLEPLGLDRRELGSPAQRLAAIEALLTAIKYLAPDDRERAVERLHMVAGSPNLPRDLMMSSEQVRNLHRHGMEIGAHTVHHPILSAISPASAEREIAEGRDHLSQIINAPVDVMAYPNGRPGRDFGAEHVAIVKRLGFHGAVTTAPGAANTACDLFQLPRFTPWNRSLPAWSARLLRNRWSNESSTSQAE